jgi:fatty-acyl-CoA synthase
VDRTALNGTSRAEPAEPGSAGARGIVSCGSPVPGVEVRIAKDSRALAERVVGDIEIRGEPVMRGYYKESEASVSPDGWCSTGDLGYLADGCLHVTGRRKEMMILRGRNYYPQDIEDAIREVLGVHKGHAVAVVLPADPAGGLPERIGVLAEVSTAAPPHAGTVSAIREAAAGVGGASVDVVLMRRNALLRTTSGKYQRLLMRSQLLEGTLRRVVIHVAADSPLPADTPASGSADGSFHEKSASSPT